MTKGLRFTPQPETGIALPGLRLNPRDTMSNELINNKFKDIARQKFLNLDKSRRNMSSMYRIIGETAHILPKKFVRDRIADLPRICAAIIKKNGGKTKY